LGRFFVPRSHAAGIKANVVLRKRPRFSRGHSHLEKLSGFLKDLPPLLSFRQVNWKEEYLGMVGPQFFPGNFGLSAW
jgi:hypothetical protein